MYTQFIAKFKLVNAINYISKSKIGFKPVNLLSRVFLD